MTIVRSEEEVDPSRDTLVVMLSLISVRILPIIGMLIVVPRVTAWLQPDWEDHAQLWALVSPIMSVSE